MTPLLLMDRLERNQSVLLCDERRLSIQ